MDKAITQLITFWLVLTTSFCSISICAATSPTVAVEESTAILLAKLEEIKPIYTSEPARFFSEVESSMAPFIDFNAFARGVMAKYSRRATESQKAKFETTFRHTLIKTYATTLLEFDNQKIEVLDIKKPSKRPDRATVELHVYAQDGKIYSILYSLGLVDDNWKLRNVTIEGINIGLQFRSQFAEYMQKYRNNIDKVIDNWVVDEQ